MTKLDKAIEKIRGCQDCYGKGYIGFAHGEDYEVEDCLCNPSGIVLDEDGTLLYHDEMVFDELFATEEAF